MPATPFDQLLESQTRFFVASVENLIASNIFVGFVWLEWCRLWAIPSERWTRMDEVERDSNVTINVGFGNITFYRDADGAYAHAVVDLPVALGSQEKRRNEMQVAMRFSCSPDTESVKDIVEKSREHLLTLLRSATSHVETATADSLLYQAEAGDPDE